MNDSPLSALWTPPVEPDYVSPYRIRFDAPAATREAGFDTWPWNDPAAQAQLPRADWFTDETARRWGSWGPRARMYPTPPTAVGGARARERLLAVAGALIGLDYQHHHVPVWGPPPDWPWKDVRSGRRGPGVDCSNFVSFVYSYALGISLPTNVVEQAESQRRAPLLGAAPRVQVIEADDYDSLTTRLLPGDIVYLRSDRGAISHCVLWLGSHGEGPGVATPLVIDCASEPRLDANRIRIPAGVRIRPFRRAGWYARAASHAHRVIPG